MTFYAKDYLRYSLKARQEVVLVAFEVDDGKSALMNTYFGWAENSDFFKELDLWKSWGVCANFIKSILAQFLDEVVMYHTWRNFEDTMDYAQKKITREDATLWLQEIYETPDLEPHRRQLIENCIKRHTIA